MPFRYAWPAELDLMARLAGMSLRERWGGWKREPFTSDSTQHVSVWAKRVAILDDRGWSLLGRRFRSGSALLGRLGLPLQQPIENAGPVELECVLASPLGHRGPLLAGHGHCEVERVSDRSRTTHWNDHRGIADGLSDPARRGGDHRPATGQHLLHQRDAESLDELCPRLAR